MKRIIALVMLAALMAGTAGTIFAQTSGDRDNNRTERRRQELREVKAPEKTTVSGTLSIRQGRIALQSGDASWYVAGIDRLIGFVDGLKEGASVSLEGYVFQLPGNRDQVIRVSTLTISGRNYELIPDTAEDRPERDRRQQRGFPGMGRGCGNFGRNFGGNNGKSGFGNGNFGGRDHRPMTRQRMEWRRN
jgi:hypothetical protein